jgi:hypothetical protein
MLVTDRAKKGTKIGPSAPFSFNVLASKYYEGMGVGGKKGAGSSISDTRCQLLIRDIRHIHKPIKVVKLMGKPHEILQHKQTQRGGSSERKSEAATGEIAAKRSSVISVRI